MGRLADLVQTGRPTMRPETHPRRRQGEDARVRAGDARARAGASARCCRTAPTSPAAGGCSMSAAVPAPIRSRWCSRRPGLTLDGARSAGRARGDARDRRCSTASPIASTLLPGDYLTTPFGTGFDAVLLSGMMHRETGETCRTAAAQELRRARARRAGRGQRRVLRRRRKNTPPFAISSR